MKRSEERDLAQRGDQRDWDAFMRKYPDEEQRLEEKRIAQRGDRDEWDAYVDKWE